MKVKMFFFALILMFVVTTGCAGVQQTGGSGGDSKSSKGWTKDDLKNMGVEETKGTY